MPAINGDRTSLAKRGSELVDEKQQITDEMHEIKHRYRKLTYQKIVVQVELDQIYRELFKEQNA